MVKHLTDVVHEEEILLGMMMQELQNNSDRKRQPGEAIPSVIHGAPIQESRDGYHSPGARRQSAKGSVDVAKQAMRALKPLIMDALNQHPSLHPAGQGQRFGKRTPWRLDDFHTQQVVGGSPQYIFLIHVQQESLSKQRWWINVRCEHDVLHDTVELLQVNSGCEPTGGCLDVTYHGSAQEARASEQPARPPRSRLMDGGDRDAIERDLTTATCVHPHPFRPRAAADPLCRELQEKDL